MLSREYRIEERLNVENFCNSNETKIRLFPILDKKEKMLDK